MFLPYKADVNVQSSCEMNYMLIGFTFLLFILTQFDIGSFDRLVLRGFNTNLLSYGFLHSSWFHVIGNMFYLWVFGSVVCSVVGNASYPALYLSLIVLSGVFHLIFSGAPVVGASGAVNGIIGFYFFLFPQSQIKCFWLNIYSYRTAFYFKAYLLIGFWFLMDILGAFFNKGSIAHVAHIGGFISGIVIAWLMYKYRWIEPVKNQKTLFQLFEGS